MGKIAFSGLGMKGKPDLPERRGHVNDFGIMKEIAFLLSLETSQL